MNGKEEGKTQHFEFCLLMIVLIALQQEVLYCLNITENMCIINQRVCFEGGLTVC